MMRSYIDDNRATFMSDAYDSITNLRKWYNFSVNKHVARFAGDIPANFEEENENGGISTHAWKNEKPVWASFDLFGRIINDCDYDITVFTL